MTTAPVTLSVSVKGQTDKVVQADFLIVACDPRKLDKICDYTPQEKAVFSELVNYTFHTTLVRVPVPSKDVRYGVILSPAAIDAMSGQVAGFRNESAKQFSLETANAMSENLVTVYQIQGPEQTPWPQAKFLDVLRKSLDKKNPNRPEWWPYDSFEICERDGKPITLTTPYFDHFQNAELVRQLPWKYLGIQGTGHTLYVHASTCFKSVLQCWQYGGMLLDRQSELGISLPAHKDARIAILGAGPSGLMFAHRLRDLEYTNIQIYEKTDRIGGKTHTVMMDEPTPPGTHEQTACELGTCYLSPAYDGMVDELHDYFDGNPRQGFYLTASHHDPKGKSFRGMATKGQFDGIPDLPPVIGYNEYILMRGYYEANQPFPPNKDWLAGFDAKTVEEEITWAMFMYMAWVYTSVGKNMPMPTKPPKQLLDANYSSFYDFLKKSDLLILTGMLEYAYSVQGYGPLKEIPAYYGMIWISFPLVSTLLEDEMESMFGIKTEAGVTVLLKGWLDVWKRMAKDLQKDGKVTITKNAEVKHIERTLLA